MWSLDFHLRVYSADELYSIFAMTSLEEGILGASNWTDVWNNTAELDILDYVEDFEVRPQPRTYSCKYTNYTLGTEILSCLCPSKRTSQYKKIFSTVSSFDLKFS